MPQVTQTKEIKLRDVWRTCNKIRAAIFRVGLNIWDCYKALDPNNENLISESKFVSVLAGPLKSSIGLSDFEIRELADYFRVQDGRILYSQMCELIHESVTEFGNSKPLVTGLEWEDPLHVNRVSFTEQRKINLIITKIAVLLNKKKMILRPYFQDYELIAKNAGTVTFAHFGRILKFLGISIASNEFHLLVKKFAKDNYTVNYVAFAKAIDEIQDRMDRHGILDLGGDIFDEFPGRAITADFPKLPRPEIGKIQANKIFGNERIFHPAINEPRNLMPFREIIHRIQRHVSERRIRINEFFKDFDAFNAGTITVSQFKRGLDAIRVSTLGNLYLAETEIEAIATFYKDPNDPDRVCWKTFEDDIDHVFTIKELEKSPMLRMEKPPLEITELSRRGEKNCQNENKNTREECEESLKTIRRGVEGRRILLKEYFKDHDKLNNGRVTRNQLRQVLKATAIILSPEEINSLEQRYNDEMGFDYSWFLKELEAKPLEIPLYREMIREKKLINGRKREPDVSNDERNIVVVLSKIKGKVVRERINVSEFMKPFDPRNEFVISRENFVRGLDQLRCNLSCAEISTIMKVFKSPMRHEFIEYARFASAVEEAVATGSLEKAPLLVPLQYLPSEACEMNFLNFDERRILGQAMDKLVTVKHPNLEELFADYDKENIGSVTKNCLMKVLSNRKMLALISSSELHVVHKCFSIERGGRHEFDYRAFLRALSHVNENKKILPF